MLRKFVSATVSAALLIGATPAWANNAYNNGLDAPGGATATINLRLPLGGERVETPSYGLTLSYGQTVGVSNLDGRVLNRAVNVADFRFDRDGLRNARVASFDFANLDQDPRLNLTGSGKKTWLILGGIIVAGVVICLAADCFDDSDSESPSG